jgi:hypothetical protein
MNSQHCLTEVPHVGPGTVAICLGVSSRFFTLEDTTSPSVCELKPELRSRTGRNGNRMLRSEMA